MNMTKNLRLSLKRQWFEMTKSGIKTEDYREINPYWIIRLFNIKNLHNLDIDDFVAEFESHRNEYGFSERYGKKFKFNVMTLGYPKEGDTERILKLEHKGIEIRTGNPEWGAVPGKLYFVIKHGNICQK